MSDAQSMGQGRDEGWRVRWPKRQNFRSNYAPSRNVAIVRRHFRGDDQMLGRDMIGSFLLIGAAAGILSALGVIYVEGGVFIAGDRLAAITPAIAFALAI